MDLSELLVHLLKHHDLAVIPDFGGFVARYQPAQMHPVEHLLKPPSKSVGFNPSLKQSDGMLLNALMQRGLTHMKAAEGVRQFSADCAQRMRKHKSLSIPRLGRLTVEPGGTITFIQDASTNLLRESFGLRPVQLTPVLRRRESKPKHMSAEVAERKPRRVGAWIAAATLVAFFATGTSLFFFNDNVHRQVVGVFDDVFQRPGKPTTVAVNVPTPNQELLYPDWTLIKDTLDPFSAQPLVSAAGHTAETPMTSGRYPAASLDVTQHTSGYFVVVGAFGSLANAERQLERVGRSYPHASMFRSNGLNQVRVFAGTSEAQANSLLTDVRASFEASAWLAKR